MERRPVRKNSLLLLNHRSVVSQLRRQNQHCKEQVRRGRRRVQGEQSSLLCTGTKMHLKREREREREGERERERSQTKIEKWRRVLFVRRHMNMEEQKKKKGKKMTDLSDTKEKELEMERRDE